MVRLMDQPPIPEKLSFKIGEAARLVGVEPHVLRYWEKEFPRLKPKKSASGHRLYSRQDIEKLRQIRSLLHERGFTLAGTRSVLSAGAEAVAAALALRPTEAAQALQAEQAQRQRQGEELEDLLRKLSQAEQRALVAEQGALFWRKEARRLEENLQEIREVIEQMTEAWRGGFEKEQGASQNFEQEG